MLDERTLQTWLKGLGYYQGPLDGSANAALATAIAEMEGASGLITEGWDDARRHMAAEQLFLQENGFDLGEIDGHYGNKTEAAHLAWITKQRDTDPPEVAIAHQPTIWPRQKDVSSYYGEMGQNQVLMDLPYQMRYDATPVRRISLHEKVAPSAKRVLERVLEIYGMRIPALGLDRYSGSLNVRKMRGGNAWSMHSWGIAIDFDAGNNPLAWDHTRARFAKAEYVPWWQAWEAEGWISLGRARDFDWMHVQAARL